MLFYHYDGKAIEALEDVKAIGVVTHTIHDVR
jgi:hypothetical protein